MRQPLFLIVPVKRGPLKQPSIMTFGSALKKMGSNYKRALKTAKASRRRAQALKAVSALNGFAGAVQFVRRCEVGSVYYSRHTVMIFCVSGATSVYTKPTTKVDLKNLRSP